MIEFKPALTKCPVCEAEGKVSRLHVGVSSSTLLAWSPYYDEQGRSVNNDPNTLTTEYWCSEGHRFTAKSRQGHVTVEPAQ